MAREVYKPFAYQTPPEIETGRSKTQIPVIIVGAGPIGLAAAIDLALHGVRVLVLDENDRVSVGSRAICWAKRSLEIFDRLGVGESMIAKGVTWKLGRLFDGDHQVYQFDLLPEQGHKAPAFINLQQYHVEHTLIARCGDFPDLIELRWKNRVIALHQDQNRVELTVETQDGVYTLFADFTLACDGANSTLRKGMELDFGGQSFDERFLIADIVMEADFPNERWFWFNPNFHPGQTALLHKQPENLYRIDLQLGWDADPQLEKQPERVRSRLEKALQGRPFTLDWISVYSFRCACIEQFVHQRVIFVGDSAHVVSPFGARGGNGGLHDVDNLCWKLAMVLHGEAGHGLLASYHEERHYGANENILHSTRATQFMSPPSAMAHLFRDQVLRLAGDFSFAQKLINSGRLSTPCCYAGMSLQTDNPSGDAVLPPGSPCLDAPLSDSFPNDWLLESLGGRFSLLACGLSLPQEQSAGLPILTIPNKGMIRTRYGQGLYLIRPDQYVAAFWPDPPGVEKIATALARARGFDSTEIGR